MKKAKQSLKNVWDKIRSVLKEQESEKQLKVWQNVLLQAVASVIVEFVIEAFSRHSISEAFSFVNMHTTVFLYNSLLIFTTSTIVFLFRKQRFFRVLIFGLWTVLGIANGVILANRVTPLTGPDMRNIAEGSAVLSKYLDGFEIALMYIAVIAAVLLLIVYLFRSPRLKGKMHYLITILCVAACFGGFYGCTQYVVNNHIISTYFGNIAFAYEDYGFPYCFTVTLLDTGISEPDGYSEESIQAILSEDDAAVPETEISKEDEPNIIVIQLESFFDPTRVRWLNFSEDPVANWHALESEYTSGYYTAPTIGAGTANTEFETLTGMSLRFFGAGEYPFKSILREEVCESAAFDLRKIGYSAHALHNNEANFYSRKTVYKNLGFEDFTSEEYMSTQDDVNENGWMRDENLIAYINDALDSTYNSDFVFTVTVQPHGSYPEEEVLSDPVISVSGASSVEKNYAWEYYVNQIYEEDQFIGDLLEELADRDEHTVVMFYGDHLPTMGLEENDIEGNLYQTNYLIWDNYGLEKKDKDITAYQGMAYLFDQIGIHEGTMFRYQQAHTGDEDDYLIDLQTLQYDILYGERYVYGGETPFHAYAFYKLGIREIEIEGIEPISEGLYYIHGKNFTQSCKVFVDEEMMDTTYLTEELMIFKTDEELSGKEIKIGVQSNSSTHGILSYSSVYDVPEAENEDEQTESDEDTETDIKMENDAVTN